MKETILKQREKYVYPTKVPYYKDPLHLVKASGSYVWDADGNKYLDVIGGIVSISVGHNHPRIQKKRLEMILTGNTTLIFWRRSTTLQSYRLNH